MDKFVVWFTKNQKCLILNLRLVWVAATPKTQWHDINVPNVDHFEVDYDYYRDNKWTDFPSKLRWRRARIDSDHVFDTKDEAIKMADVLFRKNIIKEIEATENEIFFKNQRIDGLKKLELKVAHKKYLRSIPKNP